VPNTHQSAASEIQLRRRWSASIRRHIVCSLTLALAASATAAQEKGAYAIDNTKSKLQIDVSKEGAFKMFGHDHLIVAKGISGQVQFDPQKLEDSTVHLKISAKSLTAVDPGESEKDRTDVQATMTGEKVLDVAKFPEIVFTSARVSAVKRTADGWELTLAGKLNLHGVEKPVSFPLRVHAAAGELRAQGEVSVLQTDHGITPIKVGGGSVKVKDKLKITFTIVATKGN
jgi:polyisoprenoid-binding protein YceI